MTTQAQEKHNDTEVDEQQVVDYLMNHPDFFVHNSLLLADLVIPHDSGSAVSLIERQVNILRKKNSHFEEKLREMVDAVHDNQRLNSSLQRLAINLFMADGLDDVIATVNDELRNNLSTDFVSVRLLTKDQKLVDDLPERYSFEDENIHQHFKKIIDEKRIQCGRLTAEQAEMLFADDLDEVASGAVIPIADADTYGLLGLASKDAQRYHPGMGTDFLQQLSDLVSAAIKAHL